MTRPSKPAPRPSAGSATDPTPAEPISCLPTHADSTSALKAGPMTPAERQRRHRERRKAELQALRQATAEAKAGKGVLKGWAALDRIGVVERELKERAATIKALRAERDEVHHQLQALRAAVARGLAQLPPGARLAVQRAIAQAGGHLQAPPDAGVAT